MDTIFIGNDVPLEPLSADRVGSKAANLARLARIGLRVPPAFVIGTDVCREVVIAGGRLPGGFRTALRDAVMGLEQAVRRQFGGSPPLLVSVRSSPPVSMPGMLETILNVGLTDGAIRGLLRTTGNPWLVWDTVRRFAQGFGETVSGSSPSAFTRLRDHALSAAAAQSVDELDPISLRDLAHSTVSLTETLSGSLLTREPYEQLEAAIEAVFRSSSSPRAVEYRRLNQLDEAMGTAVLVQAMVFGNAGAASGSGVGFTRNPSTGENEPYVDFLVNAQGEDVVSGRRRVNETAPLPAVLPHVYEELLRGKDLLEREFRDMQDFEFTVQDGELFYLQSRAGKRTPWAALRIAVDLVRSEIIAPAEALDRLKPYDLDAIRRTRLVLDSRAEPVASAVPAGMGVAVGAIVMDPDRAKAMAATRPVILVRPDLTTDDVSGLAAAAGILTASGGRTSHAAVVARHMGKVCVVGCASLRIDELRRRCVCGTRTLTEGDVITLDGDTGFVYPGSVPTVAERPDAELAEIRHWRAVAAGTAVASH